MDGKHRLTTSCVACHHRLWATQTVERCRALHDIIALGRQTRSNDVRRDMPSPPLVSEHSRMTSVLSCHHRLWAAHTVERRRAWHAIIALGRQTRSDDVRRDMLSPPLDSTHCRTMSGVVLHHLPWTARTVGRRQMWHAIITLGQQTRLNDVGRGRTSSPFDCTHLWTTSVVA